MKRLTQNVFYKNLILVMMVMFGFTFMVGCERNVSAVDDNNDVWDSVDDDQPLVVVIEDPYIHEDDDPDTTVEVVEEDPLEVLVSSPDYAKTQPVGVLVKKGENYYSIVGETEGSSKIGYDNGFNTTFFGKVDSENLFTFGEMPVVELDESDSIVGFTQDGSVPKLTLTKVEANGYTISASISEMDFLIYLKGSTIYRYNKDSHVGFENLEVTDEDGNLVEKDQMMNLEKGEKYTIGWFEGTNYFEQQLVATNPSYKIVGEETSIEGEVTKEGYVFNMENIEPGLYITNDGRLLQVQ